MRKKFQPAQAVVNGRPLPRSPVSALNNKIMNITQTKNNRLTFDFRADAPPLLDQMDAKMSRTVMERAAVCSSGLFEWAADQPATEQASLVARMSVTTLRDADFSSPDSVALVVGASALLMASKLGPSTASERIRKAAGILSERYQADW